MISFPLLSLNTDLCFTFLGIDESLPWKALGCLVSVAFAAYIGAQFLIGPCLNSLLVRLKTPYIIETTYYKHICIHVYVKRKKSVMLHVQKNILSPLSYSILS